MLVPVALNQTGFKIPGVAPDARGVLLGKQGAVLLGSLEQAVAFFRLLSEESTLDDILPSLHIHQVRSRLQSQELLILLHASSSYLLDRCARVAALLSGLCCTGAGRHFVKYRDRASPLGYDSDELYGEASGSAADFVVDFVIYGDAFVQAYSRVREVPFAQLLHRLAAQPVPGGLLHDSQGAERDVLYLTVRRGLCDAVFTYLWRNRVKALAAFVDAALPAPGPTPRHNLPGLPGAPGTEAPDYALLRLDALPTRVLQLLLALPGVELFRPHGDNFAVELGYRHPLRLESCASLFDRERFYLFAGRRGVCDVVARPPLVPIESLLRAPLTIKEPPAPRGPRPAHAPAQQQVALRLSRSASAPRRGTATLIPWSRLSWFKKLVYALPPPLLAGYRAAAIDEGLFVLCQSGVDGLPIGDLFREAAPSIFVPVGMEFLPRIGPEVLTEQAGGVAGRYLVFLPSESEADEAEAPRALALPHALFESLGRRALAPLAIATRTSTSLGTSLGTSPGASQGGAPGGSGALRARPASAARLVNDPVLPAFPLWGFRDRGGEEEGEGS